MKPAKMMRSTTCLLAMLILLLGFCLQPVSALAASVDEAEAETTESDDALLDAQASSSSIAGYRLYKQEYRRTSVCDQCERKKRALSEIRMGI